MVRLNFFLFIFLLFFFGHVIENAETSPKPDVSKPTATLKYLIEFDETSGSNKIKHQLLGDTYGDGKKCRILISNDAANAFGSSTAANFGEITDCPGKTNSESTRCVISCNKKDNKVSFNKISPRTKYMYVFVGTDTNIVNAETYPKVGKVFGWSTPLLVNPKIKVSIDESKKLKLTTRTCAQVACAVQYKDAIFEQSNTSGNCDADNELNSVDFGLFIPHYELKCSKYPSFFYHMPNIYMKQNMAIYEPQYYVTKKTGADKQVVINVSETVYSSEICVFSVKDGKSSGSSDSFESNCGNKQGKCYAPCKDVELTVTAPKDIYKVLLQTRNHDINKIANNELDGFHQNKFAITEPNSGFISGLKKDGVSLDVSVFQPSHENKFASCTIKHLFADIIKTTAPTEAQCDSTSRVDTNNSKCKADCKKVGIEQLSPGKSYIIVIESANNDPSPMNEHVYVRTEKKDGSNFQTTEYTKTDSTIILTAVPGPIGSDKKAEPNCEYYVSLAGKKTFYNARCTKSNPCRERCREPVTINDLEPNTAYDIKVIADKDFNEHVYQNIVTEMATLTISPKYTEQGLELNAQLSKNLPESICHYTIQLKKNNVFSNIYTCAITQTQVSTIKSQATPPSSSPGSVPDASKKSLASSHVSSNKLSDSEFELARVGSRLPSIVARAQTSSGTSSSKKTPLTQSDCEQLPLCSSIIFNDYDANEEYKVLITAVGKSNPKEIILQARAVPKANPTEKDKIIDFDIEREGELLKIVSTLPKSLNDSSTCKWKLTNESVKSLPIVKQCMSQSDDGCDTFPICKSFTISGVVDNTQYHLTVYSSANPEIFGVKSIEHRAKSSSSSNKLVIIIVIAVVGVLIICGVGFIVSKKEN